MGEIKTFEDLAEIEARAASGCSVVECWEELDDWYIACKEDVPALCAALREAWNQNPVEDGVDALGRERGDHEETIWYLRQARARIRKLEGALAEWYLASDDYAEGAETAAHDRLNDLAAECAAKREAVS